VFAPTARADDPPPHLGAQAVAADVGGATGGNFTPGGVRIRAGYLHGLFDHVWIEAGAAYTIGSLAPGCFYDRERVYRCQHAFAGQGAELFAQIVRMFPSLEQPALTPFVFGGLGAGYARFGHDHVDGAQIPLHAGVGLFRGRPKLGMHLTLEGEVGIGAFDHSLGAQLVYGITVALGVDVGL
jgi:hypothetical protein